MHPVRLPDAHPPQTREATWACRQCAAPWPCETAASYLTPGQCGCGSSTWWETRGPSAGTPARAATPQPRPSPPAQPTPPRPPHYPPSHYYPVKPRRACRQQPPYRHIPAGPGDIRPGTWTWVRPGGLHPGWGDIHHLAMITRPGLPNSEVWLWLDGTVHEVPAGHLFIEGMRGVREEWARWTIARHLQQAAPAAQPRPTAVQTGLFSALTAV